MGSNLNPYISFRDSAREAMTFYRDVFGGDLLVTTFAEGGVPHEPEESEKVMHSQLTAPNGFVLMGADMPAAMPHNPGGSISIALSGDDQPTLQGYWNKLSDGGQVQMPLEQAPWGDWFGACADRYGVNWMVNISAPTAG